MYLTVLQETLSDKHTGMTLGKIAAQAATSGECQFTKFAFSCTPHKVENSPAAASEIDSNKTW